MATQSIHCSNCGAPLPDTENRSVVRCSYCGAETSLAYAEPEPIVVAQEVEASHDQPTRKEGTGEKLLGSFLAHQASSALFDTCIWPILVGLMIIGFFTVLAIRACS